MAAENQSGAGRLRPAPGVTPDHLLSRAHWTAKTKCHELLRGIFKTGSNYDLRSCAQNLHRTLKLLVVLTLLLFLGLLVRSWRSAILVVGK